MDWTLLILAVAGVIFHFSMKATKAYSKKKTFDWKQSLFVSLNSIVLLGVLIFLKDEFDAGITIAKGTIFFVGYFSDSLLANIDKWNPLTPTKPEQE